MLNKLSYRRSEIVHVLCQTLTAQYSGVKTASSQEVDTKVLGEVGHMAP